MSLGYHGLGRAAAVRLLDPQYVPKTITIFEMMATTRRPGSGSMVNMEEILAPSIYHFK
jgi:hypothetical protein